LRYLHAHYRTCKRIADPLDEGDAPFIKIEPTKKTNWGFARASAIV
jgi:hypothetical protein